MATGQQGVATHGAGNEHLEVAYNDARLEILIIDDGIGDALIVRGGN